MKKHEQLRKIKQVWPQVVSQGHDRLMPVALEPPDLSLVVVCATDQGAAALADDQGKVIEKLAELLNYQFTIRSVVPLGPEQALLWLADRIAGQDEVISDLQNAAD